MHFWDVLNREKKVQKNDDEYIIGWNVVKDCRRVIKGVLNDEPLYLIPEQVKTFRSEEHTSELQSHSFISYAVFCLKKKTNNKRRPL